jgi:hypothetical protein
VFFLIKIAIFALVVAASSEIAKRTSLVGALIASLPLTSILAMIWLHRVPLFLERGVTFPVALTMALVMPRSG